jgi:hypothetical protein
MQPQSEDREPSEDPGLDPFPKPQTIPSGWDTSEILTAPQSASATESEPTREAA